MSDAAWISCILLVALGGSVALAYWLVGALRHWPLRRLMIVTAAPLPILLALPGIGIIAVIVTSPRSDCSGDVCAIPMQAVATSLLAAAGLFAVNLCVVAQIAKRKR